MVQSADENLDAAIIANLTLVDPEGDLDYTYTVDDVRFEVVGDQLKLKVGQSLDFETDAGHVVAVTATNVTDPSHTITANVTVDIQDLGETYQGTSGVDNIVAGAANDTLIGEEGDDTLTGGAGDDLIFGGNDTDTAVFSGNFAAYTFADDNGDVVVTGPDGVDRLTDIELLRFDDGIYDAVTRQPITDDQVITGDENDNILTGGTGNDTIHGNGGNDTISGGEGDDSLMGGSGDDTLNGNGGVDWFVPGAGNDTIIGGGVENDISYQDFNAAVTVDLIAGTTTATGKSDTFTGITRVRGTEFGDTITGGIADDWEGFEGQAGDDTMDGGSGYDELMYHLDHWSGATSGVNVNFATGTATDGFGDTDTFTGMEAVRGSYWDDSFTGSSDGSAFNSYRGLAGDDTFTGGAGIDRVDYSKDAQYQDINGNHGTAGVTVDLADGTATDGYGHTDTLSGIERVRGTDSNDVISGDDNNNRLEGRDGDDTLTGRGGDDDIRGGSGTDTAVFSGNFAAYTITDDNGDVIVDGPDGIDRLSEVEILQFDDGLYDAFTRALLAGDQVINGDESANSLGGGSGNDTITGNGGDDTIRGNGGDDTLVGSAGADSYLWAEGDGFDTIQATDDDTNADVVTIEGTGFYDLNWSFSTGHNDLIVGVAKDTNYDFNDVGGSITLKNFRLGENGVSYVEANLQAGNAEFYTGSDAGPVRLYTTTGLSGIDQNNYTEILIGTELADVITGGGGYRDYLYGLGGDDTITGGDGHDRLYGGEGNDQLFGGDGNDRFRGNQGTDTFEGGTGLDEIDYRSDAGQGGTSAVTVDLAVGTATDGFGDTDTFTSIEEVRGTSQGDTLKGSSVANRLRGHDGDDTFEGRGGDDSIEGGSGSDTAVFSGNFAAYTITDDNGDVVVDGPDGIDRLTDVERLQFDDGLYDAFTRDLIVGDQILVGDGDDNTLTGATGNDTITGNGGDDTLDGASGSDTYIHGVGDGHDIVVSSNDDGSVDTVRFKDGAYDLDWRREGDDLVISSASDNTYNSAVEGTITLKDHFVAGKDALDYFEADLNGTDNDGFYTDQTANPGDIARVYTAQGLNGTDQGGYTELVFGTDGNDTITGGGGFRDYLNGGAGDDTISAGDGDDRLYGGSGNDTMSGGDGNDRFRGHEGTDDFTGGAGLDEVDYRRDANAGGTGAVTVDLEAGTATDGFGDLDSFTSIEAVQGTSQGDIIRGSSVANRLRGHDGNDTFEGLGGDDFIDGGDGNDTAEFSGNFADYSISAPDGNGEITVVGLDGTDTLKDIERLRFNDGLFDAITFATLDEDQIIDGDGTANALVGGSGNDTLTGNGGDDTLTGNEGNDILVGGAGADVYVWAQGDGYDTIKADGDDTGADVIQIQGTGFYDLNWTWDDDHLYVGVAFDDTYDPNDVGGIIKLENFRNGSDSVEYVAANLAAENAEWYSGSPAGPVRFYTTSGLSGIDQGSHTELLIGTSGDDEMNGNGGFFDYIFGQGGNDTLNGSDITRDELRGGTGDDTLFGLSGNDRLAGEQGTDILDGGDGVDLARYDRNSGANGAYVNLSSSTRDGVLSNTATDTHGDTDTLISIENIRGSNSNDTLIGSDGDNYLRGKDGDDILEGGLGDDLLQGDGGSDTAVYAGSINDYVFAQELDGSIRVTARNGVDGLDLLKDVEFLQFDDGLFNIATEITFAADQTITGNSSNNTLTGGDGNDVLIGFGGDDTLDGGFGNDTYVHGVGDGHDTIVSSVEDGNLDSVSFTNGAYDLGWYRDGNDLVVYSASDDTYDSATEGTVRAKDHFVEGNNSLNLISTDLAGTDNDAFYTDQTVNPGQSALIYFRQGLTGVDQGGYTEVVFGTDASETIIGGGGYRDYLYGNGGDDTITGGEGHDRLYGGTGNDQLFGGDGNDRFRGGDGTDNFTGGSGDKDEVDYRRDENSGGTGAVTVDLEAGTATDGFGDSDSFTSIEEARGSSQGDTLLGSSVANRLRGHDGNDTLEGRGGDDRLDGGSGNDILRGGEGDDELEGGTGDDQIFTGNSNYFNGDVVISGSGIDTIDFETGQGYYTLYYANLTGPVTFDMANSSINKGGDGTDTLVNLNAINSEDGGLGVIGTSGNDTYIGQTNANSWTQVRLGAGADTITGGAGQERLDYRDAEVGVNVNIGTGITSEDGFGTSDTFSGIEEIRGSDHADTLTGGAGDDRFIGRDGNDTIDGAGGIDTVRYDRGSNGSVDVDLENEIGTVTGTWNGNSFSHNLSNIENIRGSNSADIIRGDDQDNTFLGKSGDDILMGRAGSDDLQGDGGADTFDFTGQNVGTDVDAVLDYNFDDGDILNISDLITFTDGTGDLVGEFVRATVSGSDLSLEVSSDNGASYTQIAVLDDIAATNTLRVILDNDELDLTVI